MKCHDPKCSGHLRMTHTYTHASQRVQRMVCKVCGKVYTAVTVVEEIKDRGTGAKARIAEIRKQGSASGEAAATAG